MTEAGWLDCTTVSVMASFLRDRITPRKDRLFNVACCRRLWQLYGRPVVREAILVGERYADGEATEDELRAALRTLQSARAAQPTTSAHGRAYAAACYTAARWWPGFCLRAGIDAAHVPTSPEKEQEHRALADLVREVFGNPFREVRFDPSWRSGAVEAMARAIDAEHDFASLPILADALEDAGCADSELLAHLRSAGPHYRGCWAMDLVLGKV